MKYLSFTFNDNDHNNLYFRTNEKEPLTEMELLRIASAAVQILIEQYDPTEKRMEAMMDIIKNRGMVMYYSRLIKKEEGKK